MKHIAIYGSVLGTRHEFAEMLRSIAEGKLKPVIDRTFPLEEAQAYFKQSGKFGKIILIPNT